MKIHISSQYFTPSVSWPLIFSSYVFNSHFYSGEISGGYSIAVNRNSHGGLGWTLQINTGFEKCILNNVGKK